MLPLLVRSAGTLARARASCQPQMHMALLRQFSSDDEAQNLKNAEKLVAMMSQSPSMQQMILMSLPASARSPEMVKQMLSDPTARTQLAQMISKQGFKIPSNVVDRMSMAGMEDTFAKASKMGINPGMLFQKLMGYPGLLKKLQQPHVMRAFLDISENAANWDKYKDDAETVEVVTKVQEILGTAVNKSGGESVQALSLDSSAPAASSSDAAAPVSADPPASTSTTAAAEPTPTEAPSVPPPPGTPGMAPPLPPDPSNLGAAMMSDPELARRLQDPRIRAAVMEIQKSPWKTIKYVFDKEVMEVFGALKNVLQGKDPWTGKKKD